MAAAATKADRIARRRDFVWNIAKRFLLVVFDFGCLMHVHR
jgi:hypothetical protein